MFPTFWILLAIFKDLTNGSPVLANRHPLILLNAVLMAIGWFGVIRMSPLFPITCVRWFLAVKGKISQFEVSVRALPTTTSSPEEFFRELFRLCAELEGANREFNHVTSHGLSLCLFTMVLWGSAFAILPIAIEGTFALVFGVFMVALGSFFMFGFLFYASGVGEQYTRAAGRIAADPGFVLALGEAAAGRQV